MRKSQPFGQSLLAYQSSVRYSESLEDDLSFECVKVVPVRRRPIVYGMYIVLCWLTLGLLPLAFMWSLRVWKAFIYADCGIIDATHLFVVTKQDEEKLVVVRREVTNTDVSIWIRFKYIVYDYQNDTFTARKYMPGPNNCQIHGSGDGLKGNQVEANGFLYGRNSTLVKEAGWFRVFSEEVLSSTNYYNFFTQVYWFYTGYHIYTSIMFVLLLISIWITVTWIRRERSKLNDWDTIVKVRVFRKRLDAQTGTYVQYSEEIDSTELVPGDVMSVPQGSKVPCDLVLLEGQTIMDESFFVGDPNPAFKTALPDDEEPFNSLNSENLLYSGSTCLNSVGMLPGQLAKGVVYQVGFATKKGAIIRSIMFNSPTSYRYEQDAFYFTLYLVLFSLMLMLFYYLYAFKMQAGDMDTQYNSLTQGHNNEWHRCYQYDYIPWP